LQSSAFRKSSTHAGVELVKIFTSIVALLAGIGVVVLLSVATDFMVESVGMFPPQAEPGSYTGVMLLGALIYRCVYTVLGGYVTARLAPHRPLRHAFILGCIGIAAATVGVVVSWNLTRHHWYPIALVITALPCTWLGGTWVAKKHALLAEPVNPPHF
jgi:peptidoglycan/LPS O-acetylase OafA/YrhL